MAATLSGKYSVREHFRDGVLWAGFGQKPDVFGVLARWGEALGDEVSHLTSEAERA